MIMINKLTLHFGGRTMFDEISFRINDNDKIGLVGRNGAGKTTLIKVLKGIQSVDEMDISIPKYATIGYLPQELVSNSDKTVYEETKTAFEKIIALEEEIHSMQKEIENRTDFDSEDFMHLLNDFHEKEQQLQHFGGYNVEEQIEKVLKGLGFLRNDFDRQMKEFSGGWQMRVELAKILLQKPDLLLLDEPTNHLDIESVTWLEKFLIEYPGAIMLISHDRAFLDNITNRTIEISRGKIEDYKVSYSKYILQRVERRELIFAAKKNQDREINQIQRNIDRFRAKASKASFAQSLIKKLDKMDKIEIEDEDVSKINIRFPHSISSGKKVVEGANVSKSYGEKNIISGFDFHISKGDKIAFVGKNGMGKTTLSRMIAGDLSYEGEIKMGHNVRLGYYAQHQTENLTRENTVLEEIEKNIPLNYEGNVRSLLGAFLFSGDDVYKKIKVLSGGEKSRLAMAKLLLQPINFLILDEPTNHLDMLAKDVLKQAMQKFEGTIIVVSHDRQFLQGLTNKVFEFRKNEIKEYTETIYEFLERRKIEDMSMLEKTPAAVTPEKNGNKQHDEKTNGELNKIKEREKELKKMKSLAEKAEKKVMELDEEIAKIEEQLKNPSQYKELVGDADFFQKYESLKQEQAVAFEDWEKLVKNLESAEQQQ